MYSIFLDIIKTLQRVVLNIHWIPMVIGSNPSLMPKNDNYEKQLQTRVRDDMEVNTRISCYNTKLRKNKKQMVGERGLLFQIEHDTLQ